MSIEHAQATTETRKITIHIGLAGWMGVQCALDVISSHTYGDVNVNKVIFLRSFFMRSDSVAQNNKCHRQSGFEWIESKSVTRINLRSILFFVMKFAAKSRKKHASQSNNRSKRNKTKKKLTHEQWQYTLVSSEFKKKKNI